MSKIIDGIVKDLKAIPETLKAKTAGVDKKKRDCFKFCVNSKN